VIAARGKSVIADMPADDPLRAGALSTLAVTLGSLFEMTGRPGDLTAAVTVAREAVTARDVDRMRRAGHLTNLGNLLRIRYEHYGRRDDLDQAITTGAEALDIARDHRDAAAMWSNYSTALRERFRLAGDHAVLEAAIDAARHGLRAAPDGSPYVVPCAIHLGCALLDRYHATNEVEDVRCGLLPAGCLLLICLTPLVGKMTSGCQRIRVLRPQHPFLHR
jgi:hypothetical protein